ncbi:unnamed protein product [Spodoptera littoralis]|uniref:Uncharacterized protein n=1 Tax=Spodoptera littoralis TaxID=7109 RepID=A0A9P0I4C4_SPOLI|nr:unnamed protein product [Spodoptera littoralis]CAH1639913.1 unnamed protein product [Spodoptera littoralis]
MKLCRRTIILYCSNTQSCLVGPYFPLLYKEQIPKDTVNGRAGSLAIIRKRFAKLQVLKQAKLRRKQNISWEQPVLISLFNTLLSVRRVEFKHKYLSCRPRALSERNLPQPQPWLMQMACLLYCARSLFTKPLLLVGECSLETRHLISCNKGSTYTYAIRLDTTRRVNFFLLIRYKSVRPNPIIQMSNETQCHITYV